MTDTVLANAMLRVGAVAPIHLLDVLALDGYSYHWTSTAVGVGNRLSAAALGITPLLTGEAPPWNAQLRIENWDDTYLPWLLRAGPFTLSRSMQADVGGFVLQNISGNTLQRDMQQMIKKATFEGAVFAYREWNLDAAKIEFEFHGQLSVLDVSQTHAEFAAEQSTNPSDYQAVWLITESCPWRYASAACGDTTNNPCQHSFLTCRQPSRYGGIVQSLVNISQPGQASVSTRNVVRNRQI
jgi:hypothetical protein